MGLRKNISELESLIVKFGYWSKEVRDFNDSLSDVNGFDYMTSINLIVKGKMQDNGTFKKHI